MAGQVGKRDRGANSAALIKKWFPQFTEAETAAERGEMFVSRNNPRKPLRGDIPADVVVHLNQDESASAAVRGILGKHGMAGGAAAGKGVENEGVFVCGLIKQ